jgi:hypothetical protein
LPLTGHPGRRSAHANRQKKTGLCWTGTTIGNPDYGHPFNDTDPVSTEPANHRKTGNTRRCHPVVGTTGDRRKSAELTRPARTAETTTTAAFATAATAAATFTAAAAATIAATTTTTTIAAAATSAAATTIAAAATTEAAATAAAAAPESTAAAAALLFAGFVDDQTSAFKRMTVQCADGILGCVSDRHGHEPETARTARLAIGDDAGIGHFAMGAEQLGELGVGRSPGQVADIDLGGHQFILETKQNIAFRGDGVSEPRNAILAWSQRLAETQARALRENTVP